MLPTPCHRNLTCVKFNAFLSEGMTAASCFAMLLQHQNSLASFGQNRSSSQAPKATANHHCVQLLWHLAGCESYSGGKRWKVSFSGRGSEKAKRWKPRKTLLAYTMQGNSGELGMEPLTEITPPTHLGQSRDQPGGLKTQTLSPWSLLFKTELFLGDSCLSYTLEKLFIPS